MAGTDFDEVHDVGLGVEVEGGGPDAFVKSRGRVGDISGVSPGKRKCVLIGESVPGASRENLSS